MSSPDFQHLRLSMVKDVAVVEIHDEAAGPAAPSAGLRVSSSGVPARLRPTRPDRK